ncbi:MAG TPA: MmgE/PrpD family protein [Candidatus Dormibacteraeota bacterium]|nr:MmgE/PrpD family protein [Candidatus Dormibacteraeota bacterium]
MDTITAELSLTGALAEYFSGLQPDAIPEPVKADATWRLVDTIGVALAGSRMDFAEMVQGVFTDMGGVEESTALGTTTRLPAAHAGFVNAAFAHGPDYDDTHSVAMVHIGCLAVPASLAVAEKVGASGAAMLTALVAGAEVGLRIGAAAPHRFHMRGFHATGVVGPFTAAVASGRLLDLDPERMANALGLAGSQAAGLLVGLHDGSWVKRLHPAWSVQAGITAALLAERGFVGPKEVLESPWGLYGVLLHNDEETWDLSAVIAGLGDTWLLPGTTFKPYSNGAWNHSTMDAVAAIMRAQNLQHHDILRIDTTVPEECLPVVCEPREAKIHPRTVYHMKFSLPYSVAILAVLGHAEVEDYTDAVLADQEIADLAARVYCHGDPSMPATGFPARVRLETRDGRRFDEDVPAQRGGPGNPMSDDDHRDKFRATAAPSLGTQRAEALLAALEHLWEADEVSRLAHLLGPQGER